ncbi:MAG TPA: carbon-nitrogen hydrolase family protein [Chitinophagaceae bacterium]|nr:carbon-nitrogen hydrolase family protein [Chitinophagaceae bacterium]
MKICVAQTKSVRGDVQANITNHQRLIELAVSNGAGIIIFPELSITGYEPELAKELATDQNDSRLDVFQQICDKKQITIGVGMPLKSDPGITISMIIFQPHKTRQVYSKQYLHSDEYPYFVSGNGQVFLADENNKIAPAICYEISVREHAENAYKNGAKIYIASVAKSVAGVEKTFKDLSGIAGKYSMTVLMSNCIGHCDNFDCGGKTSAWNDKGILLGQLNDINEGILIVDTETEKVIEKMV